MADDPKKKGEPDRSLISLLQPHEVAYWTKKFGVSREELERAIQAVGHGADAVARHLGR
jgi:hypothetical protein